MFTFLHDIAKPLAEISKMHSQPLWPTKIILRLLAANLSTTANQLSATSVLIQQNQHGDCKKNDMASFAEALFKAPTKSELNLLWVHISNSPGTVREDMYGSFDYTCDMRRFVFFLRTKKSFKLQNLPSRTSTLFLSRRIGALVFFWTATKSAAVLQNIQVNLHLTHYAQGKNDTERNSCIYNVS